MGEFVKVAKIKDIPEGSLKGFKIDKEEIVLANINGKFYAIRDVCTHEGGPLSEGKLEGKIITCPWHKGKFDITSGEVVSPPPKVKVETYEVKVEGDDIYVRKGTLELVEVKTYITKKQAEAIEKLSGTDLIRATRYALMEVYKKAFREEKA